MCPRHTVVNLCICVSVILCMSVTQILWRLLKAKHWQMQYKHSATNALQALANVVQPLANAVPLVWVSVFAGLDHWSGLLDWTTGLTFDWILGILCKLIHNSYYKVEHFFVSEASTAATNYNNAHMEHCSRVNFQVANLRKAFSHYRRVVCRIYLLVIHPAIDRFFLYLKRVQQLRTCSYLLHRHNNAAYVGTAIVQTSKWLTQLNCMLVLPCVSLCSLPRVAIFTWKSCKVDRFAISI